MKKPFVKRRLIWAYCRVSTLKAEQELSLEQQVAWAREFPRQRGAELVIYPERALAKTITHRPECVRLINDLEAAKPAPGSSVKRVRTMPACRPQRAIVEG